MKNAAIGGGRTAGRDPRRIGSVLCALIAASVTTGGTSAWAGENGSLTSPAGNRYDFTIPCSTRTMKVTVTAADPATPTSFTLGGVRAGAPGGELRSSISGFEQIWRLFQDSAADAYAIAEQSTNGIMTQLGAPIPIPVCQLPAPSQAARFNAVSPERVVDTRNAVPTPSTVRLRAGGEVDVPIAGRRGVPAGATAVAINLTATDTAGAGYLQAYPTGRSAQGEFSSLNVERAGQTIANFAIVPLGDGGTFSVFSSIDTDVIVDLLGYFSPSGGQVRDGRMIGITPTRVTDTRNAVGYTGITPQAGQTVTVDVAGTPGLPSGVDLGAAILNVTAVDAKGSGYVQVAAHGSLVPGASSNVNVERAGQTVPNLVIVPLHDGRADLYVSVGTELVVDVVGAFTSLAAPASSSGLFVPLTPERVWDTRPSGGWTSESEASTTPLPRFLGLPSDAGAVALNLVAIDASAPGFIQLAPADRMIPGASSSLNIDHPHQTVANAAIVAVGTGARPTGVPLGATDRAVGLHQSSSADTVVDLFGYFTR